MILLVTAKFSDWQDKMFYYCNLANLVCKVKFMKKNLCNVIIKPIQHDCVITNT